MAENVFLTKEISPVTTCSVANDSVTKKTSETGDDRNEKTFKTIMASLDTRHDENRVSLKETLSDLTENKEFFGEYLARASDDEQKSAEAFRALLALKEVAEDTYGSDLSKAIENELNKAAEKADNYFFSIVAANITKRPFEKSHPDEKRKALANIWHVMRESTDLFLDPTNETYQKTQALIRSKHPIQLSNRAINSIMNELTRVARLRGNTEYMKYVENWEEIDDHFNDTSLSAFYRIDISGMRESDIHMDKISGDFAAAYASGKLLGYFSLNRKVEDGRTAYARSFGTTHTIQIRTIARQLEDLARRGHASDFRKCVALYGEELSFLPQTESIKSNAPISQDAISDFMAKLNESISRRIQENKRDFFGYGLETTAQLGDLAYAVEDIVFANTNDRKNRFKQSVDDFFHLANSLHDYLPDELVAQIHDFMRIIRPFYNDDEGKTLAEPNVKRAQETAFFISEYIGELRQKILDGKYAVRLFPEHEMFSLDNILNGNPSGDITLNEEMYRLFSHVPIRSVVEQEFSMRFSNIPLRVQMQFIRFISTNSKTQVALTRRFLETQNKETQTNRLKSFLSLEYGGKDMGPLIIAIGKKYPQDVSDMIFSKYADMTDRARDLAEKSGRNDLEEKMLERAKSFLEFLGRNAERYGQMLKIRKPLEKIMENFRTETALQAEAIRACKEHVETERLQDFMDGSFEISCGQDLTPANISEMENIYVVNYADMPDTFRGHIIRSLYDKIQDPSTRFYIFFSRDADSSVKSINAFCSFQDKGDHIYFGSFNVHPFLSGAKMGEMLMDAALENEAKKAKIVGHCIPDRLISSHYIEKRLFTGTRIEKDTMPSVELLEIVRNDRKKAPFATKLLSKDDIIRLACESEYPENLSLCLFTSMPLATTNAPDRNGYPSETETSLNSLMDDAFRQGYVLTRYFVDGRDGAPRAYLAFEKVPDSET